MKVHLAQSTQTQLEEWENEAIALFRKWLTKDARSDYEVVDDPEKADLVLLFQLNFKTRGFGYLESILREPVFHAFPDRMFCLNQHDSPFGLHSGLYTGMCQANVQPDRHVPWAIQFLANPYVHKKRSEQINQRFLFTFRGSITQPVRKQLLQLEIPNSIEARVTEVDRWFDHTDAELREYVEEILDSKFVLCPRGYSPTSHRLFETMALDRCPVIISDEWAAIGDVDWDRCSIRIAESQVEALPALLAAKENEAETLGVNAGRVWERLFSPRNGPREMLDRLRELHGARPTDHDERTIVRTWLLSDLPYLPRRQLTEKDRDRVRGLADIV